MIARLAFPFAALSAASILLTTVLGGAGFPGYSHSAQFISELGARGAPDEMLVRFAGFLPGGLFLCLFCLGMHRFVPRSVPGTLGVIGLFVYALGYVAAAFFPCDPGCRPVNPSISQLIHNFFGLVGYVVAPGFLALLGWASRRWPGGAHLSVPAFIAAVLALVGLMGLSPEFRHVGLSQRLIEGSVMTWIVLCGWHLRTKGAGPLESEGNRMQ